MARTHRRRPGRPGPSARRPSAGLASALLGTALGCAGGAAPPAPQAPANVVLIVVDTLRRDHLVPYGYGRPTSPALQAFAEGAVVFERAYAPAPWTLPSVASVLTGLYPSRHGAFTVGHVLKRRLETLAEIFAAQGYATAGVVSHVIVSQRLGFDQGFASWDEEEAQGHDHVSTPGVTRRAIAQLDALAAGGAPFFLFVHYFDPHYEYRAHPEVGFEPTHAATLEGGEDIEALRGRLDTLGEDDVAFLRARYDEEIRVTDGGIGRLLEHLQESGLAERTVVAFTADHGEEFLERGWLGHTRTLYEELIAVPLLVRGAPGSAGHGQRVSQPVSTVSLAPTLLDLAGVDAGGREFEAPSLAPFVRGGDPPPAGPVFAEVDFRGTAAKRARMKAVIGPRYKLIRDSRAGRTEVFDLEADPGERSDLAGSGWDLAIDTLQRELERFREREAATPDGDAEEGITIDPEFHEQLRALGYVSGDDGSDER